MLIVGGAAGMITGVFPPTRTTTDVDVMIYAPDAAMSAIECTAEQLAPSLELELGWLNSQVQLRRDLLPPEWRSRRIFVGVWGRLHVSAISRPDLIAMKIVAGRTQDLEDIQDMGIRTDEVTFVQAYLKQLPSQGTPQDQIEAAHRLLRNVETYDEDLHH